MSEAPTDNSEQLHIDPAEKLQRDIVVIEEDFIVGIEQDKYVAIKAIAPDKKTKALEIYRQEAAALRALDPLTVTFEDIAAVKEPFESQIRQLFYGVDES